MNDRYLKMEFCRRDQWSSEFEFAFVVQVRMDFDWLEVTVNLSPSPRSVYLMRRGLTYLTC